MKKKMKKYLIEYGILGTIMLALFLSGLHTEVFGVLQRGVLATGALDPDVDEKADTALSHDNPQADFSMKLIDSQGKKVNLAQFRGKVIFINIWATWCPPCIAEMPGINKLFNDMSEDVVFLMLSVDQNFEKARRFKEKKGFDFEVYKLDGAVPEMYYTESIPTTFVIDAEGELALRHEGMANYNTTDFKEFLRTLKKNASDQ